MLFESSPPAAPRKRPRVTRRSRGPAAVLAASIGVLVAVAFGAAGPAAAAGAQVDLGTAGTYSVLGGQTVTNTGPSVLNGDLGVSPGTAITGFPPGQIGGSRHAADAAALQAQSDLTIAYDDAAGRAPTASVAGDLVGTTKVGGVYKSTGPLALSGTLTLDGQGNPNAVFIFQVASTLTTATASYVNMINGAQACNVFWQVGSSATLGTASVFRGTILALTSISVTTGGVVQGRALARNGAVTLDNDTFTSAACGTTTPATSTTTSVSVTPNTTPAGTAATATATVTGTGTPTGTVVFSKGGTPIGSAPVGGTGHASLTVPAGTTPGTTSITATYGGDTTSLPSTSPPATLTVTPAPTSPASSTSTSPSSAAPSTAASTSTSASTSGSAPASTPDTTSPVTTSPVTSGAATTTEHRLASTGAAHLDALVPASLTLLALGVALTVAGQHFRRRQPKHRA